MYDEEYDFDGLVHKGALSRTNKLGKGSRVMMYSDEEKPFFVAEGGVETLASVPHDSQLPDSFTRDNPKFTDFKSNYWKPNYPRKSNWDSEFQRTRIYILDPSKPIIAIKQSEEYARLLHDSSLKDQANFVNEELAWKTLILDPHVWMFYIELRRQDLTYAVPDIDMFRCQLQERYSATNGKFLNARRLVLRSQALNHELMDRSPVSIGESGQIEFKYSQSSIARVISSLDAQHSYDSGDSRSLKILQRGQSQKFNHLKRIGAIERSVAHSSSIITEVFSKDVEQTQFAGIAAGHADHLYKSHDLIQELPQRFESVWLNGKKMSL